MQQRCLSGLADQPGIFGRNLGVCRAHHCMNRSSWTPAHIFCSANDGTGTAGYVGVDPARKVIVVAFKGTDNAATFAYE